MMVLDTNVVSELMRPKPEPKVLSWIDKQNTDDIFLTSTIAAELLHGVERMQAGTRKRELVKVLRTIIELDFHNRILPFDLTSAHYYAQILSECEAMGKPVAALDAQIAAVCAQHRAKLITRNQKHFQNTGLDLLNPWLVA